MPQLNQTAPKSNFDALVEYVSDSIAQNPHEFLGSQWCRQSHDDRASAIGVSERTIRELIKRPPFITSRCLVDGRQTSLVKIGEKTPDDVHRENAIIMASVWKKRLAKAIPAAKADLLAQRDEIATDLEETKAKARTPKLLLYMTSLKEERKEVDAAIRRLRTEVTPHEFGCLVGLSQEWESGIQVAMFAMVLDRWDEFMSGVKYAQAIADEKSFFLRFPHIPTIRRYQSVASEMAMMEAPVSKKPAPKAMA